MNDTYPRNYNGLKRVCKMKPELWRAEDQAQSI